MLGYACITCLWTLWTTDFPCLTKGKSGQSLQRHFYCAWLQMKAKCPNVILQSPNRAGYYQKYGGKRNLGVCRQGTYRECPLQALTVCTSELWKRVHNYYSVRICDKLMLKFRWGKKHKMQNTKCIWIPLIIYLLWFFIAQSIFSLSSFFCFFASFGMTGEKNNGHLETGFSEEKEQLSRSNTTVFASKTS